MATEALQQQVDLPCFYGPRCSIGLVVRCDWRETWFDRMIGKLTRGWRWLLDYRWDVVIIGMIWRVLSTATERGTELIGMMW